MTSYTCNTHADLTAHLRAGSKVATIKTLRTLTGLGLKEAMDIVNAVQAAYDTQLADAGPDAYSPPAFADDAAHYVVVRSTSDGDYVTHFKGEYDNRQEAMSYARDRVERSDVHVARVIAVTKRTLETL